MKAPVRLLLALAVGLVVAGAVVWGFLLIGSPNEARLRRLDERRSTDMREIYWAMNEYWARHKSLPPTLANLANEPELGIRQTDPETGQPYEYRIKNGALYEICANFGLDSTQDKNAVTRKFWSHGTGHKCFQLEAMSNR